MGCGPSFPNEKTDVKTFLKPKELYGEQKTLAEASMMSDSDLITFLIKSDLLSSKEESVIKKADGTDYMKTIVTGECLAITNLEGTPLAVLVEGTRHTEINGCECVMTLPHMYIYSFTPYLAEGQWASEFKYDDKPLYPFARMHAEASLNPWKKVQKYEIAYATNKLNQMKGERQQNSDMFSASHYIARRRLKDTEFSVKRDWPTFNVATASKEGDYHKITCGTKCDTVLMACLLLISELLFFRL
jgi:hypothetical protein